MKRKLKELNKWDGQVRVFDSMDVCEIRCQWDTPASALVGLYLLKHGTTEEFLDDGKNQEVKDQIEITDDHFKLGEFSIDRW